MKGVLCNRKLSLKVRLELLESTVMKVLMWQAEAWTTNTATRALLKKTQNSMRRRVMAAPFTGKMPYHEWKKAATGQARRKLNAAVQLAKEIKAEKLTKRQRREIKKEQVETPGWWKEWLEIVASMKY